MFERHHVIGSWQLAALLAAVLASMASVAEAQESAPDEVLDEIVVTATRMRSPVREVPRSISVVGQERIQNATQQLGLDEALAAVPGLYMQNRYNFSQDLRVSLRGFGARAGFGIRGIRVYVDGIPETLPDGQAQVDSIDLGSAKRIEVLRGPASSLYGNASGGVISVETELEDTLPFIEGGLAGGELGFGKYHLKTGGSFDSVDYLFNASRQEIDGYRDHSFSRGTLVNGKVGVRFSDDDRLTVALNHTDQPESDDAGGINLAEIAANPRAARDVNVLFNAGEALSQQRIGLVYERDRAHGDLALRNYYVWRDFSNELPFVDGGAVDLQRFFYGVGAQYSPKEMLPDNLELTMGVDLDRQDDERRRFDNNEGTRGDLVFDQQERVDSTGIYLQGNYDLTENLMLSAGLRYDELTFDINDSYLQDGDDSGEIDFDETSPSAGISYDFGEHMLFGSFSRSFETPTTTELANPDGSGGFNTSLKPQLADNFELGIKGERDGTYYEVAVFHIDLTDELVPFELPGFPGRTFYSNAGESERQGIETALAWKHESGLAADLSYTFSDFTFEDFVDESGNSFAGEELPGLPRHFGYAGVSYRQDAGLFARLEAVYSGALYADNANTTEVGSYVLTNFRASREFDSGSWLIRPYFGVNNIFNEGYNSNIRINAFGGRYYEPAPERNFYAGVVVRYRM
ncbi:MAG TPA: TonB-dependent receptor [Woeseiaceae bacterium]|nr:TonB-dependent receptor [Woeseiaceae bacterium]